MLATLDPLPGAVVHADEDAEQDVIEAQEKTHCVPATSNNPLKGLPKGISHWPLWLNRKKPARMG